MPNKELQAIRKKLGHASMKWEPSVFLNTGIPELNCVIGHRDLGIPYGQIIEIHGLESMGKTAITMTLSALGQHDGAHVVWLDLENSFKPDWAIQRGLAPCPTCSGEGYVTLGVTKKRTEEVKDSCPDCGYPDEVCSVCTGAKELRGNVCAACLGTGKVRGQRIDNNRCTLIQPYVGVFGKEKDSRLVTSQELCSEAESVLAAKRSEFNRMILVLDSIPAILTEGEAAAGLDGRNLRSNMELPMFLSSLVRRWVGLAQTHNALMIFINQMRQNPMQRFGDPWYTPGGNGLRFAEHVRVKVRRLSGAKGRLTADGETKGIKGIMKSVKNKAGGIEGSEVGYKLWFAGKIEFVDASEIKSDGDED